MAEENVIPRRQPDPDGLDFAGLREHGMALLQALAGEEWTDYNLHDPGVTLLEMLVYGLTDLLYRTEFPVPDLLSQASGHIDFAHQALFEPQTILPSAPVTLLDYRKLIYDALPGIDDVWLQAVDDPALPAGLLAIHVKPHDPMFAASDGSSLVAPAAQLLEQVIALFARERNLCQDLYEVNVVQVVPYFLCGEIEIDDSRLPADLYADIYFQCSRLISAGARMQRHEDALAAGKSWEDLLRGPLTEHGYLDDAAFASSRYQIDVVKLIALILRLPGVKQVRHLNVINAAHQVMDYLECDPGRNQFPVLQYPQQVAQLQLLQLVRRQKIRPDAGGGIGSGIGSGIGGGLGSGLNYQPKQSLPQDETLLQQVRLLLKKREFEHQAFRRNQSNLPRLLNLPHGKRHALNEYVSVSNHAPPIYGINRFGIPRSEPPEVHARARQLKAYLYPFEQIMANYLQSLQDLPHLYSLDTALKQSYFSQFLRDAEVPDLEVLYRDGTSAAEVAAVLARYDPYCERRHRVLDSLLAMYGETFPTDALRRFNHYRREDGEYWLIECKIAFLAHLCQLSARRGMAHNVTLPYGQGGNAASLQQKIMLLIGAGAQVPHSLLAHLHTRGQGAAATGHALVSAARYKAQLPAIDTRRATPLVLPERPWVGPVSALPYDLLCLEVLRAGIDLDNYFVLPAGAKVWLCLQVEGESAPWPLWQLAKEEVPLRALQLQAHLIALNRQSEGLHLLEHILLRPHAGPGNRAQDVSFHSNRISVILPAISRRFADPAFRSWVEELVAQQLPAHIYPEFYWLEHVYLQDFEQRHQKWLGLLARWNGNHLAAPAAVAGDSLAAQLDQAAEKLMAFLHKNRARQPGAYWI